VLPSGAENAEMALITVCAGPPFFARKFGIADQCRSRITDRARPGGFQYFRLSINCDRINGSNIAKDRLLLLRQLYLVRVEDNLCFPSVLYWSSN